MKYNVTKYGDVECNCGRILSPDLTDLVQSCIFCSCCEKLGNEILHSDYRFYHDKFLRVVKWRYADDGDGYVDKMEDKYEELTGCPFCGEKLSPFIERRLNNYTTWLEEYRRYCSA